MSDLLDVVNHGEELPLGVDLPPTSQREAPHPLVLKVRKHRFHSGHPPASQHSGESGKIVNL